VVDFIKKCGNLEGVGTGWSVILEVLLITVVVHGQGLRYPQESVYCMRSIGGYYKVCARGDITEKKLSTDG
jgi:hypothetical protein